MNGRAAKLAEAPKLENLIYSVVGAGDISCTMIGTETGVRPGEPDLLREANAVVRLQLFPDSNSLSLKLIKRIVSCLNYCRRIPQEDVGYDRHALSNTEVLCFVLGWQGGTLHQVAGELGIDTQEIIDAGSVRMGELCRQAQAVVWQKYRGDVNRLLHKHLVACVGKLKLDYNGHETPIWLERADGVARITGESL